MTHVILFLVVFTMFFVTVIDNRQVFEDRSNFEIIAFTTLVILTISCCPNVYLHSIHMYVYFG